MVEMTRDQMIALVAGAFLMGFTASFAAMGLSHAWRKFRRLRRFYKMHARRDNFGR
jgi:hypothetical protein